MKKIRAIYKKIVDIFFLLSIFFYNVENFAVRTVGGSRSAGKSQSVRRSQSVGRSKASKNVSNSFAKQSSSSTSPSASIILPVNVSSQSSLNNQEKNDAIIVLHNAGDINKTALDDSNKKTIMSWAALPSNGSITKHHLENVERFIAGCTALFVLNKTILEKQNKEIIPVDFKAMGVIEKNKQMLNQAMRGSLNSMDVKDFIDCAKYVIYLRYSEFLKKNYKEEYQEMMKDIKDLGASVLNDGKEMVNAISKIGFVKNSVNSIKSVKDAAVAKAKTSGVLKHIANFLGKDDDDVDANTPANSVNEPVNDKKKGFFLRVWDKEKLALQSVGIDIKEKTSNLLFGKRPITYFINRIHYNGESAPYFFFDNITDVIDQISKKNYSSTEKACAAIMRVFIPDVSQKFDNTKDFTTEMIIKDFAMQYVTVEPDDQRNSTAHLKHQAWKEIVEGWAGINGVALKIKYVSGIWKKVAAGATAAAGLFALYKTYKMLKGPGEEQAALGKLPTDNEVADFLSHLKKNEDVRKKVLATSNLFERETNANDRNLAKYNKYIEEGVNKEAVTAVKESRENFERAEAEANKLMPDFEEWAGDHGYDVIELEQSNNNKKKSELKQLKRNYEKERSALKKKYYDNSKESLKL